MNKSLICANCKKEFTERRKVDRNKNVYCSVECAGIACRRVKTRPSGKDILDMILIEGKNYSELGRMYGVSDNAIRKWIKADGYELPKKQKQSVSVECSNCNKSFQKENNRFEGVKNHFCSRDCHVEYERGNGPLSDLDECKFRELKKTMSVRAIARSYGVHHSTLLSKFK